MEKKNPVGRPSNEAVKDKKRKKELTILSIVLGVVVLGIGGYYLLTSNNLFGLKGDSVSNSLNNTTVYKKIQVCKNDEIYSNGKCVKSNNTNTLDYKVLVNAADNTNVQEIVKSIVYDENTGKATFTFRLKLKNWINLKSTDKTDIAFFEDYIKKNSTLKLYDYKTGKFISSVAPISNELPLVVNESIDQQQQYTKAVEKNIILVQILKMLMVKLIP